MCKYAVETIEKAIKWYRGKSKRTMAAVENRFGISQATFSAALKERKILSNQPHCQRKVVSAPQEINVLQLLKITPAEKVAMKAMYKAGSSLAEVAEAYCISKTCARKYLLAKGVKLRTRAEGTRLRYGIANAKTNDAVVAEAKIADAVEPTPAQQENRFLSPKDAYVALSAHASKKMLTDEQREEIVEAYVGGMSLTEVSVAFNVSTTSVRYLVFTRRGREALRSQEDGIYLKMLRSVGMQKNAVRPIETAKMAG